MNPWKQFTSLIAPSSKTIVTVAAVNADGTVDVTLANGATIRVAGAGVSVGDKVVIQEEKVIGKAPTLPIVNIIV
mgnify:CR=1 FL=1